MRFGKNEVIRGGLNAQFSSRGWCGNASDHFRTLRDEAHTWLVDERNPTVCRWILDYIEGLGFEIDRSEIEEERRD